MRARPATKWPRHTQGATNATTSYAYPAPTARKRRKYWTAEKSWEMYPLCPWTDCILNATNRVNPGFGHGCFLPIPASCPCDNLGSPGNHAAFDKARIAQHDLAPLLFAGGRDSDCAHPVRRARAVADPRRPAKSAVRHLSAL